MLSLLLATVLVGGEIGPPVVSAPLIYCGAYRADQAAIGTPWAVEVYTPSVLTSTIASEGCVGWDTGTWDLTPDSGQLVGKIGPAIDYYQADGDSSSAVAIISIRPDIMTKRAESLSATNHGVYTCWDGTDPTGAPSSPTGCNEWDGSLNGFSTDNFNTAWLHSVPLAEWDEVLDDQYAGDDPCGVSTNHVWGAGVDKTAYCTVTRPMLYGTPVATDGDYAGPHFHVTGIAGDLRVEAYRDFHADFAVQSLQDMGHGTDEALILAVSPKPGWWAFSLTNDPATACLDTLSPAQRSWGGYAIPDCNAASGATLFPTPYAAGEFELALNIWMRTLLTKLDAAGFTLVDLMVVEAPDFLDTPIVWMDSANRRNPRILGYRASTACVVPGC